MSDNRFMMGFGLMRLPKLADETIDVEQVKLMVDKFLEAGGTYFDTAFAYPGSEEAIKKALVERYPRESYTLATKLIVNSDAIDEAAAKQEFYTSLERTGAGYFDYYLLHAFQRSNYKKYDEYPPCRIELLSVIIHFLFAEQHVHSAAPEHSRYDKRYRGTDNGAEKRCQKSSSDAEHIASRNLYRLARKYAYDHLYGLQQYDCGEGFRSV